MKNTVETSTAATFASWLDSISTQGARVSSLLLVLGFAAMSFTLLAHKQELYIATLATFALHGILVWPLERVLCLRLAFDAKLFASISAEQYSSLADLDSSLAKVGLRKENATGTSQLPRDLAARIAGTQALIRAYGWALGAQFLLVIVAVALYVAGTLYTAA
jgi:hypothetical protein